MRNYIAQNAIDVAEKGDYSEVRRVLRLLENPYSDTIDFGDLDISGKQQTVQDEDAGIVLANSVCSEMVSTSDSSV